MRDGFATVRLKGVGDIPSGVWPALGRVLPLNSKNLSCAGQGQELPVNFAVPPLPNLHLIICICVLSVGTKEKIP